MSSGGAAGAPGSVSGSAGSVRWQDTRRPYVLTGTEAEYHVEVTEHMFRQHRVLDLHVSKAWSSRTPEEVVSTGSGLPPSCPQVLYVKSITHFWKTRQRRSSISTFVCSPSAIYVVFRKPKSSVIFRHTSVSFF